MGYLLKEAMKSICGVNRWSYAVFWKIGCQNPKLLIWEDCYYEAMPCSVLSSYSMTGDQGLTLEGLEKSLLSSDAHSHEHGSYASERVELLVKKMMISNQIHVVGEGLVGRTAFTGNHQWIVSGNSNELIHPPEVVSELQHQFSAGMQTIAVIPAIPHGVIQLGSSLAITESTAFVHEVKALILRLGCIPSSFMSDAYARDASPERMPLSQVKLHEDAKKSSYPTTFSAAMQTDVFQDSGLGGQPSRNANTHSALAHGGPLLNEFLQAEVTSDKPDSFFIQGTSFVPGSGLESRPRLAADCRQNMLHKSLVPGASRGECSENGFVASGCVVQSQLQSRFSEPYDSLASRTGVQTIDFSNKIADDLSIVADQPFGSCTTGFLHPKEDMPGYKYIPDEHREKDLFEGLNVALSKGIDNKSCSVLFADFNKMHSSTNTSLSENKSSLGEELFDAFGLEFKNKILGGCDSRANNTGGANMISEPRESLEDLTSVLYPDRNRTSKGGVMSASGSDHLLDAVVSGVYSTATQISDGNISCRTALSKASCSSVPSSSPMFVQGTISQQMCELFTPSNTFVTSADVGGGLTRSCSLGSSFYGSHISSWIEQGPTVKQETSVASANSKKSGEAGKPTRKRLKPGENPKPRPKDRQLIQDRVKELREIVPNGGKCSIDSLLEKTIKHMLFLQSVTEHADKLNQIVKPKTVNKDDGPLLKDNFEGGATWAYEVGSQPNVPIVVEDVSPPRQFLIEMLCKERGLFLEIASMVRGIGLTILKGVMERRKDEIWARFAVEANRDTTRVDIFLTLVHLLQQSVKSSGGAPNNDSNTSGRLV